jgi:cytochrome c oxidase subunit II
MIGRHINSSLVEPALRGRSRLPRDFAPSFARHRWNPERLGGPGLPTSHGGFPANFVVAATLSFVAGCSGPQTPLAPASREAQNIEGLWWLFVGVSVVVFAFVTVWLLLVIFRGRREWAAQVASEPPLSTEGPRTKSMTILVVSAVVATIVILFGLLVADFSVGRSLQPPQTTKALTIKITGRQWWWQIEYLDPEPVKGFITANELHLPVGQPVQLLLQSADVIHSFWIPNLQGKKDLIPGHQTSLWLTPDRVGTFRGQCAEFCGYQHAHMRLLAIVETPEEFGRWQEAQRQSAPAPSNDSQRHGQHVFLSKTCAMCHTIQGTPANSRIGPPLTHLASQQTIAAGSFPNNRGHLAGWILDPQALKPGVRMPPNQLSPDDLQALLDYLESLK